MIALISSRHSVSAKAGDDKVLRVSLPYEAISALPVPGEQIEVLPFPCSLPQLPGLVCKATATVHDIGTFIPFFVFILSFYPCVPFSTKRLDNSTDELLDIGIGCPLGSKSAFIALLQRCTAVFFNPECTYRTGSHAPPAPDFSEFS